MNSAQKLKAFENALRLFLERVAADPNLLAAVLVGSLSEETIWRRDAIADAGGWQHDTLTEDLDLSYRAQLRGWRFVFVSDVIAPAEVPVEMNAFK